MKLSRRRSLQALPAAVAVPSSAGVPDPGIVEQVNQAYKSVPPISGAEEAISKGARKQLSRHHDDRL